jgi:anti-sigma B factor antagonist
VLITVDGECDITTAPRLHDALLSPQCLRAPRVIVSLAGPRFLDSAGVYALLAARSALAHDGATLVLAVLRPTVSRVLALVGANRLLDVYPTLAQAISGG